MEQLIAHAPDADAYFWGTHAGAELDLLLIHRGRRYGFEFKYSDAPTMTKSLHVALADLNLERAWIVYPGKESYPVHDSVEVVPLEEALSCLPFRNSGSRHGKSPRKRRGARQ